MKIPFPWFKTFRARRFSTINTKVVIPAGFAVVILLGLLPALFSRWALDHSNRVMGRFIDVDEKVTDLSLTSITKMIKVRRNEKDFLLSYRDFGFQEAKSRYITTLEAGVADIRDNMARIRQLVDDPGIKKMADEIDQAISEYQSGFLHTVELYGVLGAEHFGIEGEIRDTALKIEGLLRLEQDTVLLAALFSLRSREKDYFLQDLDAHLAAVTEAAGALKKKIAAGALDERRKTVLLQQVERYAELIRKYAKTSDAIGAARRQYLHSLQNVEPSLERLSFQMMEKTGRARAGIQSSEARIRTAIIVSLGLAIIASLIVSLVVFRMLRDAEERLQASEQKYRVLFETSPDAIVITGMDRSVVMANKQALLLTGYDSRDDVVGQDLFDFVAAADRPAVQDELERRLKRKPLGGIACGLIRKSGGVVFVEGDASVMCNTAGAPEYFIFAVRDVTERIRAEEQIRFLASIIESLPNGVCAINRDASIIAWNRGAEKMMGYKAADIIGRPITTIIPEEIARQELDHCREILNAEGYFSGYESTRLAKDGRRVPVEMTGVAIKDAEGNIWSHATIFVDITNRKRAEQERLRSATLNSIGLLAGGIAHDINNLLTAIVGDIQLAQIMRDDKEAADRLAHALDMCRVTSELSRRFITFATGGDPVMRPMAVSGLIRETVGESMKGTAIMTEFLLPAWLYQVAVDEVQMRQVVHNLAANAREAMPQGGIFTVRGENLNVAANDSLPIRDGRYLRMLFTDSGVGIAPEDLSKIFDPYYSTKDTYSQKGLGLGLAVCYSVVKKHGGLLTVESEHGKGTTFYIYLPAAET